MAFTRPHYEEAIVLLATKVDLGGTESVDVPVDLKDRGTTEGIDGVALFVGYAPGASPVDGLTVGVYPSFDSGAKGAFATTPWTPARSDDFTHASQGSTTVDADSAATQTTLNVAATTNFAVGDTVIIDAEADGGGEELAVIATVNSGVSLVMEANLTHAHTLAQADTVKKIQIVAYTFDADTFTGVSYFRLKLTNDDSDSADDAVVFVRATVRRGYEAQS